MKEAKGLPPLMKMVTSAIPTFLGEPTEVHKYKHDDSEISVER